MAIAGWEWIFILTVLIVVPVYYLRRKGLKMASALFAAIVILLFFTFVLFPFGFLIGLIVALFMYYLLRPPMPPSVRKEPAPTPTLREERTPIVVKEREVVREREVVKIRCPYCKTLYEESLGRCPKCGTPA